MKLINYIKKEDIDMPPEIIEVSLLNGTGTNLGIIGLTINTSSDVVSGTPVKLYDQPFNGSTGIQTLYATSVISGSLNGMESTDVIFPTTRVYSIKWDSLNSILDSHGYSNNFKYRLSSDLPSVDISEDIYAGLTNSTSSVPVVICFGISVNSRYYYTTYPDDPNIIFMDFDSPNYKPTTLKNLTAYDPKYLYILVACPILRATNSAIPITQDVISGEEFIKTCPSENCYISPIVTYDTPNNVLRYISHNIL